MYHILDTINDVQSYFVFYESQFVLEASSFLDGITWIFGLYHMFNLSYPKGVSLTLEFLQRYCLKVNSNEMRGHKKTKCHLSRVLNLITKLSQVNVE